MVLLMPIGARAHIGSSDVFFEGKVGDWPTHITIRMPTVVPGRAEIIAQVQSAGPVTVSYTPIAGGTAIRNAPPAERALPVWGETNVFTGDLWLMTFGAYSIEVKIHGTSGEGTVQIPVNSTATAQLPLPPWMGAVLLALGLILCVGAMAIVGACAGESTLPVGLNEQPNRRRYWIGAVITAVVLILGLVGGNRWWQAEENNFRAHLRSGGWPDLATEVRMEGSQRILQLTIGKGSFSPKNRLALALDHGKLLHLFLVGLPGHQAFAHIHPVRKGNTVFEVALPPLPEGDYELYCDMTLGTGLSSTATNVIFLPAMATNQISSGTNYLEVDPDDSWATDSSVAVREQVGGETVCRLPDGTSVVWKAHPALQARQDAGLNFEVRDADGKPADLQPYMGMMSHAVVLRSDGGVFAHLHPTGNYSMAAQMVFDAKLAKETGTTNMDGMMRMPDGTIMRASAMGSPNGGGDSSSITLPYEFPTTGDYRVWVQIKSGGEIKTAIFDATVK